MKYRGYNITRDEVVNVYQVWVEGGQRVIDLESFPLTEEGFKLAKAYCDILYKEDQLRHKTLPTVLINKFGYKCTDK